MMKKNKNFIKSLLVFICLFFVGFSNVASAATVWSTTFNCNDWDSSMGVTESNVNCDGLVGTADAVATDAYGSYREQITVSANNPNGGGGKGARHWRCDGKDAGTGNMIKTFTTSAYPEIWIRWYMRHQQGFQWAGGAPYYEKWLYIRNGYSSYIASIYNSNTYAVVSGYTSGGKINNGPVGRDISSLSTASWSSINAGGIGDGNFHAYETHLKTDTNGQDGIAETWVDGVKVLSATNLDYNTLNSVNPVGWSYFLLNSNASSPSNGRCMYVDYDDYAVSTTGYIGPITGGATDTTPPSAPSGLVVN